MIGSELMVDCKKASTGNVLIICTAVSAEVGPEASRRMVEEDNARLEAWAKATGGWVVIPTPPRGSQEHARLQLARGFASSADKNASSPSRSD